jgi:hypothetical protein
LQRADPAFHRRDLVVGQGFGGEEQQRGGGGIVQQVIEEGQRVAQRLAGRRAGRQHDVASGKRGIHRLRLVRVELRDPLLAPRCHERIVYGRPGRGLGGVTRQRLPRRHIADEARVGAEGGKR